MIVCPTRKRIFKRTLRVQTVGNDQLAKFIRIQLLVSLTSKEGGWFLWASIKYQRGSKKNEDSREAKKISMKIEYATLHSKSQRIKRVEKTLTVWYND